MRLHDSMVYVCLRGLHSLTYFRNKLAEKSGHEILGVFNQYFAPRETCLKFI